MKYDGYIEREQDQAEKMSRLENVRIPEDLDFKKLNSFEHGSKRKAFRNKTDNNWAGLKGFRCIA